MQRFQPAYLGGNVEIYLRDGACKKKIMDKIAFK